MTTETHDHLGRPYLPDEKLEELETELSRYALTTHQAQVLLARSILSHGRTGDFMLDVVGEGEGERQSVAKKRSYEIIMEMLHDSLIARAREAKN